MPIVTTIEGKIAQIAIDRPEKRNTLNSELCKDLAREFLELNDDTWTEFVDTCNSMGLPEIIEVYQNAYDEYQAGER